jgi:hypothetical protein
MTGRIWWIPAARSHAPSLRCGTGCARATVPYAQNPGRPARQEPHINCGLPRRGKGLAGPPLHSLTGSRGWFFDNLRSPWAVGCIRLSCDRGTIPPHAPSSPGLTRGPIRSHGQSPRSPIGPRVKPAGDDREGGAGGAPRWVLAPNRPPTHRHQRAKTRGPIGSLADHRSPMGPRVTIECTAAVLRPPFTPWGGSASPRRDERALLASANDR